MVDVYVKGGVEIPGDSWVLWTNAAGDQLTTQPINMTTVQMSRAGVTVVQQDPMPDPFYGPVVKDPNNPGKWVQTLYTPAELKPMLEGYSASVRSMYETGSIIVQSIDGDYGAPTTRGDRTIFHNAFTHLKDGSGVNGTVTVKLMRVKTVDPPAYGNVLYVQANLAKATEVLNATNTWSNICFTTEHNLFGQIEAGTVTTKEQIDATYLTMRVDAFPV